MLFGEFDNNGFLDIYVLNDGGERSDGGNRLYLNYDNVTFADVTQ